MRSACETISPTPKRSKALHLNGCNAFAWRTCYECLLADRREVSSRAKTLILLEHVKDEMVPRVVTSRARVVVVPTAVVHWNLHLSRVAIVHAVAAAIVVIATEVLWVEDVGIMVEA